METAVGRNLPCPQPPTIPSSVTQTDNVVGDDNVEEYNVIFIHERLEDDSELGAWGWGTEAFNKL